MSELLPLNELRGRLLDARAHIDIGGLYHHYRGEEYRVSDLAILETDREIGVVYHKEDAPDVVFIRPLKIWLEEVEYEGNIVPRFHKVSP